MHATHCPICHGALPAQAPACPSCRARRTHRKGMSPRGFTAFASLWLACSAVILLLAFRIAAAPWLPSGSTPEYALAVLGATEAAEPPGCRVTVRDLQGRQIQTVVAGSCGAAEIVAARAPEPKQAPGEAASALQRRLASGLHSALALGIGALLTVLLRVGLRRAFSRHTTATTWLLRAGA